MIRSQELPYPLYTLTSFVLDIIMVIELARKVGLLASGEQNLLTESTYLSGISYYHLM